MDDLQGVSIIDQDQQEIKEDDAILDKFTKINSINNSSKQLSKRVKKDISPITDSDFSLNYSKAQQEVANIRNEI